MCLRWRCPSGMRKSRHSRRIVPDQTFANRICLGRLRRGPQHGHAHRGDALIQLLGEDAVSVVDEEAEGMILRESFAQLLLGPVCAGMIGDVDVQDSSPGPVPSERTHKGYGIWL